MLPAEKAVRLLLKILRTPNRFTKKELAIQLGYADAKPLRKLLESLSNAGLDILEDEHGRIAIEPDREFKELKHLQSLSEKDRGTIKRALQDKLGSSTEARYLNRKLETLYDFQQLGLQALRKPVLDRLGLLESANKQKKQVILVNYRSNSSSTRNRRVEPFHIDPELDTLQAYDVEAKDSPPSKHFKLSRIERVILTNEDWNPKHKHHKKTTDVFRIANDEQRYIHLKLKVQAYNDLIETYPKARKDVYKGNELDVFHFETQVNANFTGLVNFVMANSKDIEIIESEELRQKIKESAERIIKKIEEF